MAIVFCSCLFAHTTVKRLETTHVPVLTLPSSHPSSLAPTATPQCPVTYAHTRQYFHSPLFAIPLSSGLWPFATVGWPAGAEPADATSDLARFYPASVMETGLVQTSSVLNSWTALFITHII
jgi:hypothetical protein